jgi:hypothetical protein
VQSISLLKLILGVYREALQAELHQFLRSAVPEHRKEALWLLEQLCSECPWLMTPLIPHMTTAVLQAEKAQRSGLSKPLRCRNILILFVYFILLPSGTSTLHCSAAWVLQAEKSKRRSSDFHPFFFSCLSPSESYLC